MRAIKVYCPPGVEPPLYAFIDALERPRREKADLPHFGRNCCCRNYHYETEDSTHMKKSLVPVSP